VSYHFYTLWLFTFSDVKTVMLPSTAFALIAAFSGPILTTNAAPPPVLAVLRRLPLEISWLWLTLLLADISNQRQPSSIPEDRLNKPWRPLAAGRLTVVEARRLLFVAIPVVLLAAWIWFPESFAITVACVICTYMYNDLGGADESSLARNVLNTIGVTGFGSGAAKVLLGASATLNATAYHWLALIFAIVATTLQAQDMEDVEGDRVRGRLTLPLLIGDGPARWSIAVLVAVWSVVCPVYWRLEWSGYVLPIAVGFTIAWRSLVLRSIEADKRTWRVWNAWMVILYLLPVWTPLSEKLIFHCSQAWR
jgi:4-hydroxybenzoate polyprenyltransferase